MSKFCEENHTAMKSGPRRKCGFQLWSSLWSQPIVLYLSLVCTLSHYHRLYYLHLLFLQLLFQTPSLLQQTNPLLNIENPNHSGRTLLKPCFAMSVYPHTYTLSITEKEMPCLPPSASPAAHLFDQLRALLCQSALLSPLLQPLLLFWILPTVYSIF